MSGVSRVARAGSSGSCVLNGSLGFLVLDWSASDSGSEVTQTNKLNVARKGLGKLDGGG